jgi:hypothetical protein
VKEIIMRCRVSIAVLGLGCFFSSVGHAGAQAKPAPPAGVLAPGVREEPSPTIVSIKGAGTANAVAEALMTAQTLKEHCQENARPYPSGAACAFAARVTDFRTSQSDQRTKIVSATVRFVNKTTRPLILGYVRNAAVAINEAGNRYTITSPANVRGIGEIAVAQFDPKFTVAPCGGRTGCYDAGPFVTES